MPSRRSSLRNFGSRATRAPMVSLKSRVSAVLVLFLSPFIVLPVGRSGADIVLLALLATTTQHNHQTLSVFTEIDPISRPEVDSVLEHAGTNALNAREIAGGKPGQSGCHFGRSLRIQMSEPVRKRAATLAIEVFSNFAHPLW